MPDAHSGGTRPPDPGATARALLEAIPLAACIADRAGRVAFCNAAAARLLGCQDPEGLAHSGGLQLFRDAETPPDGIAPVATALERGEAVAAAPLRVRRADGSDLAVSTYATAVPAASGLPDGILVLLSTPAFHPHAGPAPADPPPIPQAAAEPRERDAEGRSARLQDNASQMALLLGSITDYAIYMVDREGVVASWNPGAERIKGYRPEEIIGHNFACFYTPRERADDLPRRALATALQQGRYEAEGWRVRKDGSRFWAHVVIDPVYEDGECVGFAKITRDITERMHAQRRLLESERRARGVIDTALDGFAQLDEAGQVIDWNPRAEAMFGWRRGEALGQPLEHLILAPADRQRYRQILPPALPDNLLGGSSQQIRATHRDGHPITVELSASLLVLEDGRLFNVFMRDLTEKLLIEAQLRQSQKMEAVGKLTGGIAHDFNNLLQGIIGSLDLIDLRLEQGRTQDLERFVDGAQSSARRAASLTHRLLAFSRRQPLDPRPVEANPLIVSVQELLARTVGERIRIEFALDPDLWVTRCDPGQLESALLNLAINARDAMPDGGCLTLRSRNAELAPGLGEPGRDIGPGQYVCIEVADTGTGMSEDIAERAFEPFFTTKPTGQGTGLGLSMVYGFARQSRGFCEIDTAPDQGTRVRLYLPRAVTEAPHPDRSHRADPAAAAPGRGETVLVVEDEPVVRNVVVEVLRQLGYRAIEADDGQAGLQVIDSGARIDLLISDIGLPGMDGREVADRARQRRPQLGVLLMTGYAANAASPEGFLAPGMALITKPFTTQALATRVQQMLTEH